MSNTAPWDLQSAIHDALANDAGVSAAVGGRIFDAVPEGAAYPMIVIGEGKNTDAPSFGSDGREMRPEIQVWSQDADSSTAATGTTGYKTAEAIAALVRGVMMAPGFSVPGTYATVLDLEDEHGQRIQVAETLLCRCVYQTYVILLEDN